LRSSPSLTVVEKSDRFPAGRPPAIARGLGHLQALSLRISSPAEGRAANV
jgi:hypothetical protein